MLRSAPCRFRLRRIAAGLTLVELIVVVCVIGVASAVLLTRLRFYQEAAEKAVMESNVGVMKSALQLRVAAMLLKGEQSGIESLARENPIEWLAEPPHGYRGEFVAPQPSVPRGSWYFDAARREIVYVPDLDAHLERLADGSKRLRFRVRVDHGAAGTDSPRRATSGIGLEPVLPYTWF